MGRLKSGYAMCTAPIGIMRPIAPSSLRTCRAAATRSAPELRLGASPRAALQLLRASRARAALDGRDYVIPDDIQALIIPVFAHRLLPTAEALVERHLPEQVVARIVAQTPLPRP